MNAREGRHRAEARWHAGSHPMPPRAAVLAVLIFSTAAGALATQPADPSRAQPVESRAGAQPLLAQARRVVEAMDYLGAPLSAETKAALAQAGGHAAETEVVAAIESA